MNRKSWLGLLGAVLVLAVVHQFAYAQVRVYVMAQMKDGIVRPSGATAERILGFPVLALIDARIDSGSDSNPHLDASDYVTGSRLNSLLWGVVGGLISVGLKRRAERGRGRCFKDKP